MVKTSQKVAPSDFWLFMTTWLSIYLLDLKVVMALTWLTWYLETYELDLLFDLDFIFLN